MPSTRLLTAAVEIVEFRFGHAVVDVDGRRLQRAVVHHLVQAVDAGGGFFRHAADSRQQFGIRVVHDFRQHRRRRRASCSASSRRDPAWSARCTTRIPLRSRPSRRRPGCPWRRSPRRHDPASRRYCRTTSALGAEIDQRLDQHRGLDRHVQAADDARALERLRCAELVAQRHQARHFGLGDLDFLAAPIGETDIGNLVIGEFGHLRSSSIVMARLAQPSTLWPGIRTGRERGGDPIRLGLNI